MEFRILGPLEVLDGSLPIPIDGSRQRQLLAILLISANQVVSTDDLVDALWGEAPPHGAANALQAAVSRLRRCLPAASDEDPNAARVVTRPPGYVLIVDRGSIDAVRFERLAADGRLALVAGDPSRACDLLHRALGLWRGPALAEFSYEAFARTEIDRLEELRLTAIEGRIEAELACGRHAEVLGELWVLAASHPFRERLRGHLMVALYRTGRQAEALQAYREGSELLVKELGVGSGPELDRIHRAILDGDPSLLSWSPPTAPGDRRTNLPLELTSFVGREQEAQALAGLVVSHRLVTVTGPGGAGKTRLALHVAAGLIDEFGDGAWHVDLVSVPAGRYLTHAIARSLGFPIDAHINDLDADSQLLDYLRQRSMLLVLDNFEHLVAEAGLLADIVAAAPNMRLLVTSRERLGLRDEWVVELPGLPYTAEATAGGDPEALCLFLERARQAHPAVAASNADRAAALRICALVEGMPLALELAAAWAPVLSCREIADEIARSLDFLVTAVRDTPREHRSLRAAFDHSWSLLSADERAGLQRLAVFRGAFGREEAAWVAGVDLRLLSALVAKSVVRRQPEGRYGLHELIRQFAAERLTAAGDEVRSAIVRRHAQHYVRLLTEHERSFVGGMALEAREQLRPNMGDLRDAMVHAISCWEEERAVGALRSLLSFYRAHGLHEGIPAFRELVEVLEDRGARIEDPSPAGRILLTAIVNQAFCETICGIPSSEHTLRRSIPILRVAPGLRRELGLGLLCLGTDVDFRGGYREALGHLEEGLGVLREVGDESLVWPLLLWLGWTRMELGHYRKAMAIFREAHEITTRAGDLLGIAYSLSKLGTVADARGAYAEGKQHHLAALGAFHRLGDRAGPAYAVSRMSMSAWGMGDHAEAERLGREGLELFTAIGHRWGIGTSYCRIGFAQLAQGKLDEAAASLRSALEHALDHRLESVGLYALIGAGALLARRDEPHRAAELLGYVLCHPGLPAFYRPFAERELRTLPLGSSDAAATLARASVEADLTAVGLAVLNDLQPDGRVPVGRP
jgi:predicted ATPase